MAIVKLFLAILVSLLLQLSSTIAVRQPSFTYGVAKKEGEINSTTSVNGGVVCGSASEGGTVQLSCQGGKISQITFASFGNPKGYCGSFSKGTCEAPNALSIVQQACIGKESCSINASTAEFGATPCQGTNTLAVEATC